MFHFLFREESTSRSDREVQPAEVFSRTELNYHYTAFNVNFGTKILS